MKPTLLMLLMIVATIFELHAQAPQLVADLNSGGGDCDPTYLTAFNGKLYFFGYSPYYYGLFSYSGTGKPTMVCDVKPYPNYLYLHNEQMGILNGRMYFPADTGTYGTELYSCNGIDSSILVADLTTGASSSRPHSLITYNNKLYFFADYYVYSYDGTNAPVKLSNYLQPATNSRMVEYNNKLYFSAQYDLGYELYVYDPSTDSVKIVENISVGNASSFPTSLTVANGKLYFFATTYQYGNELYSYDGTTVSRLTDLAPGTLSGASPAGVGFSNYHEMAYYDNSIFFNGSVGSGKSSIYRYDIANGNTVEVYEFTGGSGNPYLFTVCNGDLYFVASSGTELWKTNGVITTLITGQLEHWYVSDLFDWNGVLYFNGYKSSSSSKGFELYRLTDGTSVQNISFDGLVQAYPVPTRNNAILKMSLNKQQVITVRVVDMLGKQLWRKEETLLGKGETKIEVPLEEYSTGTYFYQIIDGVGICLASGKLIKED